MHKLTEPQVSAHECAKPGENNDNETVIINPMFAAVAAPKHGALSNNASSTHHTHRAVAIFPFNLVEN